MEYLQNQLGFNIKYNNAINSKEELSTLENNYDAVFIGVGLGATRHLGLDGEDKDGVIGGC